MHLAFTPISNFRLSNHLIGIITLGKKALEFLTLKKTRCKINSYMHWISIGMKQTATKYLYYVKKSVFNKDRDLLVKFLLYLEGFF